MAGPLLLSPLSTKQDFLLDELVEEDGYPKTVVIRQVSEVFSSSMLEF
jgi:hypothetical protein